MATIKSFTADISSISPHSDEGLMLKMSALKLIRVAILRYQLS